MKTFCRRIDLAHGWRFEGPDGAWHAAEVPGTIQSDLLRHRMIPDPHYGRNELDVGWVDQRDWTYRKEFNRPAGSESAARIALVFEGLDTFAEILLNDEPLGRVDNMFRTHRFDVTGKLRPKGNVLSIRFESPTRHALELEKKYGVFVQANGWSPRQHLRKAACGYGWDWGVRLPTMGIWRSVFLELEPFDNGIEDVALDTIALGGSRARLELRARSKIAGKNLRWIVSGKCGPHRWRKELPATRRDLKARFGLSGVRPWMVRGYGQPNLYDVTVELRDGDKLIDSRSFRFGFRTMVVEQKRDRFGRSFRWVVNGVPIWVRGANWIPVDSMIPRDHDRRTRELLELACDANMNALRVWGGGVFESDLFYDLCDEMGILVWQDFMFACGLYPEHAAYAQNVRHEAVDNIRRLRHHASLALWCGNNENDWAYESGWKGFRDKGRLWGGVYYHKLLPQLCRELDPHRFYWPSSPFGAGQPNGQRDGDVHTWDVVFQKPDFKAYRQSRGRFVSEFGTQGMPTLETFKASIPSEEWHFQSPAAEHHQRHVSGQAWLIQQIAGHFKVEEQLAAFTHVSQVFQGEAVKFAVEFWRSLKWQCAGALYWQLNDVWPVVSWSSIDSELRPKALHFYAKRFFAPLLVTFQEDENPDKAGRAIELVVVNENLRGLNATLEIVGMDFEGRKGRKLVKKIRVPANGRILAARLRRGDWIERDARRELIFARLVIGGKEAARNLFLFELHRDLHFPVPHLSVRRKGQAIEVSTDVFAKGVWLHRGEKEIPVDDNYFDLLPGEKRVVKARAGRKIPAGLITATSIL